MESEGGGSRIALVACTEEHKGKGMAQSGQPAYRYLDHTSDLGLEISGRDLAELFANAALAMFDNIVDLAGVEEREVRHVMVKGDDLEAVFMDWLRELLFIFSTDYFIVRSVAQIEIRPDGLVAELRGERFDAQRHRVKLEIKTPTYHLFRVARGKTGCSATIVFDV
ncbi:MAG: archease [candidate division WOR-3 bacterium]